MNYSNVKKNVFVILAVLSAVCLGDRMILKQGQTLTGQILAEKEKEVVMDIGVTVLVIPKSDILQYEYTESFDIADVNASDDISQSENAHTLYRTAELEKTTVEKCVDRVAEAVVKVGTPAGLGSGFFINEDGYLITNCHVIEKETKIEVTVFKKSDTGFEKRKFKSVRIEAVNPFLDLALLKVEDLGDEKVKFAYLGNVDKLRVGEPVFAIGTPLGLERTVTDGVISTTSRSFEGLVYLQTTAAINPGNSGGPLFNLAGEVVGVTNMGYIFFGGLGFAIPANYVKDFIKNRESFAYDKDNPNTGFRYTQPDSRRIENNPKFLNDTNKSKEGQR
ncbi:MAG: trypsin-like peptidase domain-containing protein [Phycisphaerae bacterium]|nr:trypsin-like peptidase domain-containing protein [Phycisphaerae bacterium]